MSDALSEHLSYSLLPGRNALYRRALAATLPANAKVADLGCGVGTLGLIALECGAAEVFGIDSSPAVYLVEEIAKNADLAARYHCLAGSTFHTKLPERVDAIICDHVGFFGVDYGIVRMLDDARERMLKPGGVVMPQSLDLVIALATGDGVAAKASAWTDPSIPEHLHRLDIQQRNSRHPIQYRPEELASDAVKLGTIAFDRKASDTYSFSAELVAAKDSRIEGLAGWFDCHLGAGVRMTNSPLSQESIKREQAFLPLEMPVEAKAGDRFDIRIRFQSDGSMLTWWVNHVEPLKGTQKGQTMSQWKSTPLCPADLADQLAAPLKLSTNGQVRAFVLALVDGKRTGAEIAELTLEKFPDAFPTPDALADFVKIVLRRDCQV